MLLFDFGDPTEKEMIAVGAILEVCLGKDIDLELILEKWQVHRLEELETTSARQVMEWLAGQLSLRL
jgi:hypothetical protein